MSADANLNLGGNADFIRPKYNDIILRTFFMHKAGIFLKGAKNK